MRDHAPDRYHMRLTSRSNGEHHVTVPRHDPLRVGTLAAILDAVAILASTSSMISSGRTSTFLALRAHPPTRARLASAAANSSRWQGAGPQAQLLEDRGGNGQHDQAFDPAQVGCVHGSLQGYMEV